MAPPYDQNLLTNILQKILFADEGSTITYDQFDDMVVIPIPDPIAIQEVVTSKYGVLVPRVTGLVSVTCSSLIIYLILRSPTRLSSSYHRIMFGMSCFDVIGSLAISLTILPMPKNDSVVDSFGFDGVRLGNYGTCTAQAFFINWGTIGTYFYNFILCAYYFVAIGLLMTKRNIERYVEPLLHIVATGLATAMTLLPMFKKLANPSNMEPYCSILTMFAYVTTAENTTGFWIPIRGDYAFYRSYISIVFIIAMMDIVLSFFFLVCVSVIVRVRERRENETFASENARTTSHHSGNAGQEVSHGDTSEDPELRLRSGNTSGTKGILIQSFCYFAALIITLLFRIEIVGNADVEKVSPTLKKLQLFFAPLQGFFNFIIFVFSKIVLLKAANTSITIREALHQMFIKPRRDPLIITNTDIVDIDRQIEAERIRMIELHEIQQRRRQECDNSSSNIGDESSRTPSRANTNDNENVNYVSRPNIVDRYGLIRTGLIISNHDDENVITPSNQHSSLILVNAADPTAKNVGDEEGLNETGLLEKDDEVVPPTSSIVDNDDMESVHNSTTTSNQDTDGNEGTGSNNVAGTSVSHHSPQRILSYIANLHIAYPKSSQGGSYGNTSNSLGGFTNMSEEV